MSSNDMSKERTVAAVRPLLKKIIFDLIFKNLQNCL